MAEAEGRTPEFASLFRLDGQNALVVGGYGGIGEVLCELFAKSGASVAVAGRSLDKAEDAAERLAGSTGTRAVGVEVDVTDRESAKRAAATVVDRLGSLDILVNCASSLVEAKAEDLPEDEWRRVLDVNLTGAFLLSQAVGRVMLEARRGGRIIHFSSTRSVAGGRRGFAAYSASKGGLNLLIKQLATEWAPHGITVNGVAPGFVRTEFVHESGQDQRFVEMLLKRIPLARFGEPFEMAAAALFLAAPAASFVTGQIVFVDGGVTASS